MKHSNESNGSARDALAMLLDQVDAALGRYVSFPSPEARWAVTLWTAHTHLIECFDSTPRLALLSAEKQSGKTRTLEILEFLCVRANHVTSLSPAAMYRMIQPGARPTLLVDEIDTVYGSGPSGASPKSEDLRAVINSGHRANGKTMLCAGPSHQPTEFPTFTPIALAGIGVLPDTIADRSVVVRMKRRSPTEHVHEFRLRQAGPHLKKLRDALESWSSANRDLVAAARPEMPPGIRDRAADVWEPLLAIAEAAGGEWPARARGAATSLTSDVRAPSDGVVLLQALRRLFAESGEPWLGTQTILYHLHTDERLPWTEHTLDPRSLAKRLQPFEVSPIQKRVGEERVLRGYRRADLEDPWRRYLPPETATPATSATAGPKGTEDSGPVARVAHVAGLATSESGIGQAVNWTEWDERPFDDLIEVN